MHNQIRYRLAGLQRQNALWLEGKIPKSEGRYLYHSPGPSIHTDTPPDTSRPEQGERMLDLAFNILPTKYHPKEYDHSDNSGVVLDPDEGTFALMPHYEPDNDSIDLSDNGTPEEISHEEPYDSIHSYDRPDSHLFPHTRRDPKEQHARGSHLKLLHMLQSHINEHPEHALGPVHDDHIEHNREPNEYGKKVHDFITTQVPKLLMEFEREYTGPASEAKPHFMKFLDDKIGHNSMVGDYMYWLSHE